MVTLQAAAGGFGEVQEGIAEFDDPDVEWVAWDGAPRFAKGMFVAEVCGRSMEPEIPDGGYCLFRRVDWPSSPERAVLVRFAGAVDPETGGQYAVKRIREHSLFDSGSGTPCGCRPAAVVLVSVNREFGPVVVEGGVRVVGEVVGVLG